MPERAVPPDRGAADLNFRAVYETWFEPVSRWIRALGGREADRDDIVQEVFVVVRRRLPAFKGDDLAPWLYRITQRLVRDFSRRTWIKRIFNRRSVGDLDQIASQQGSALDALERKEGERILDAILAKMPAARRATFVLFEIDGLSGDEIAQIQGVPVNTVWTRLHQARKEFFEWAARLQRAREADEERRRQRLAAPGDARDAARNSRKGRDGR